MKAAVLAVLITPLACSLVCAQDHSAAAVRVSQVPDSVKERLASFVALLGESFDLNDPEFPPRGGALAFVPDRLVEFFSKRGALFTEVRPKSSTHVSRTTLFYRGQRTSTSLHVRLSHVAYVYRRHPDVTWIPVGAEYEADLAGWYKVRFRMEGSVARIVRIDHLKADDYRPPRRAN